MWPWSNLVQFLDEKDDLLSKQIVQHRCRSWVSSNHANSRRKCSFQKWLVKLSFKRYPCSYLNIMIYLRYHLCCVINVSILDGCSSVQDQLKNPSQWKDWVPYNQTCKTSINLQPVKQSIFSVALETAVHMNFALNIARFFRTPILNNIW